MIQFDNAASEEPGLRYWQFERFELSMTLEQALGAAHVGECDADVLALSREPGIRAQLQALDGALLRRELKEYGAWDAAELADHEDNLQRILWLAAGNIREEYQHETA